MPRQQPSGCSATRPTELVGIEVYSLLHPDDLLSPANGPQRYVHKDGTYVVLEGRRLTRRDELGFVAGVVTILRGPAALTPRTAEQRIQDAVALEPDPVELLNVVAEETALDLCVDGAAVVRFETGGFGTIVGACEPRGSVNLVPGTTVSPRRRRACRQGLPDRQGRSRSRAHPRRRPALGRTRLRRRPGATARDSRSRRSPRSRLPTQVPSWRHSPHATSSRTFPITAPSTSSCGPSRGAQSAMNARSRSSSSTSTTSSGSTPSTVASQAIGCWPRSAGGWPRPSEPASSSRGSPQTTSAGFSPRPKASTAGSPPSGRDARSLPLRSRGSACDCLRRRLRLRGRRRGRRVARARRGRPRPRQELRRRRNVPVQRRARRRLRARSRGRSRPHRLRALACRARRRGSRHRRALRARLPPLREACALVRLAAGSCDSPRSVRAAARRRQARDRRGRPPQARPASAAEREQIRNHPDTGAEIAVKRSTRSSSTGSATITSAGTARAIRNGVAGKAIPVGARLLALAEAWDSMTSSRVYGDALGRGRCTRRVQTGARNPVRPRGRGRARTAVGARRPGRRRRRRRSLVD